MKRRIFLTGGSGMVGNNILEHPEAGDWEFLAPNHDELDLSDYQKTVKCLRNFSPDVVIHAAGRVGGIQANIQEPVDFLVTNLDLGRNVVLAARASGVSRLINLGSSCMYPCNLPQPLDEEAILHGPFEPTNEGYALAKVVTERLCRYIRQEDSKFNYKTLIPCNLYGRHDKFSPKNSHLIPAIIHKIHFAKVAGGKQVDIWGDGTARREFMYAGDLADAIFRALKDFNSLPDLMNLGIGHDYSIGEYYQTIADVIGWKGQFVFNLDKPVGMKQKLVSVARQECWGWKPVTNLREGIEKTYRYYLEKNCYE